MSVKDIFGFLKEGEIECDHRETSVESKSFPSGLGLGEQQHGTGDCAECSIERPDWRFKR